MVERGLSWAPQDLAEDIIRDLEAELIALRRHEGSAKLAATLEQYIERHRVRAVHVTYDERDVA